MKTPIRFSLFAAFLAALVVVPQGHGAAFPPPPIERSAPTIARPTAGGPGNPGPPNAPGTPGAGLTPSPGAKTGPSSPGAVSLATQDLSSWHWWWEFNKEPYLRLRTRLDEADALSRGDGYFLGHGRLLAGGKGHRAISDETVGEEILPALRDALATRDSNDMISGCLIGLARIGNDRPPEERDEIAATIRPFLRESNQALAEIAAVALGLLGHPPAALHLGNLLLDTEAGRRLRDDSEVPDRQRTYAAYGLTVLGAQTENEDVRRYVVHLLLRALENDGTNTPDLATACVIGLGRVPLSWSGKGNEGGKHAPALPASASREGQIRHLLGILEDDDTHRFVQSHAATSLAVLLQSAGDGRDEALAVEVTETLIDQLTTKARTRRELRQSCAIALGMLGDGDEDELDDTIRRTLLEVARNDRDVGTRRFALLGLGRVAARESGKALADPKPTRTYLLKTFSRGDASERRWAGLSLALLERARTDAGEVAFAATADALHVATQEADSPMDGAAFSIACGLLRDLEGEDEVLAQLEKQNESIARGYVAVALGLLDSRPAVDPLRRLAEESTYQPWLLRGCALALGMLGDPDVVDVLLEKLRDTQSISAKSSIAQALGRIGDDRTVEPLLAMLTDDQGSQGSRAFAAIALGLIAERDELPWNTFLMLDLNYLAAPPTLYDTVGFGVLNIL